MEPYTRYRTAHEIVQQLDAMIANARGHWATRRFIPGLTAARNAIEGYRASAEEEYDESTQLEFAAFLDSITVTIPHA